METQGPLKITIHPPVQQSDPAPQVAEADGFFGADGLSFKDILDVINPLQQLPLVSSIYRGETGDTISTASRLLGGALLGGPIGFVVALANSVVEQATGRDVAGNILTAFNDDMPPLSVPEEPMPTHGAAGRGAYSAYVRAQSLLS